MSSDCEENASALLRGVGLAGGMRPRLSFPSSDMCVGLLPVDFGFI
jgi:hypothetical protein